MTIEVVRYASEHARGVKDLIVPIQREEFGIDITWEDQPDLHDIPQHYRKGIGDFWVALDGKSVVGSIALIDIGNGQAALRKMFVKREYRGGSRGVASELLKILFDHATTNGSKEIYLGTTRKFLAAHRFYEKSGFHLIEEFRLPKNFPRMSVDIRFYVRRLP